MKLKITFIIFTLLVTISGCEKALDFYVGMPFQPKNISSEYVPGLNIFGILKAGPSYDTLNHFFEVQQLLHSSDTTEVIEIDRADVILEQVSYTGGSLGKYQLTNYNKGKYTNSDLSPDYAEQWSYECTYNNFMVTSSTFIPNEPELQQGSLIVTDKNISFTLRPDTTAFLYEIFYFNDSDYLFERIIPNENEATYVDLTVSHSDSEGDNLFVFAYDENYEKYITTSNIFYKPNAFRPRYTTVEGGYGCFCSTAGIKVEI